MKKYAQVANFNIVFGEDEKPMLYYFDTLMQGFYLSATSIFQGRFDTASERKSAQIPPNEINLTPKLLNK